MSKRISAIDWIKLVLAGCILCLHYGEVAAPWTLCGMEVMRGGNLAVEGFFLISGFLFMRSVDAFERQGTFPSCPRVVFHRYLGIFYWLLPAVILDAAVVATGVEQLSLSELLANIPRLLFELVPLQMAGCDAWYVTGVSWYISALLLTVLIFYPIARRNPRAFALEFCPILAVLLYGMMYHVSRDLGGPAEWMYGVVRKGLLRGLADMALGCFLFECVRASKDEIVTVWRRILYTVAATVAAAVCGLIMLLTHDSFYDFVFLPFAFAFLYLALGQKTVFALFINHEWTKHVGTISTVVFLVHFSLARYFAVVYPGASSGEHFDDFLLYVAVASAVVFAFGSLLKWLVYLLTRPRPETESEDITEEKEAL